MEQRPAGFPVGTALMDAQKETYIRRRQRLHTHCWIFFDCQAIPGFGSRPAGTEIWCMRWKSGVSGDRNRHFHGPGLSDGIPCFLRLDHHQPAVLPIRSVYPKVPVHWEAVRPAAEKPVLARKKAAGIVSGRSAGVGASPDMAAGLSIQNQRQRHTR